MPRAPGNIAPILHMKHAHTVKSAPSKVSTLDKFHREISQVDPRKNSVAAPEILKQAETQIKQNKFVEPTRRKVNIGTTTEAYLDIDDGLGLDHGLSWDDSERFWTRHPKAHSVKQYCVPLEQGMEICFNNLKEGYFVKRSQPISSPNTCQLAECTFYAESKLTSRWTRLDMGEFPAFNWASLVHPGVKTYLPVDDNISSNRLIRRSHPGPITMHLGFKEIVWRIEGYFVLTVPPNDQGNINNTANVIIDIPLANHRGHMEGITQLLRSK
ncbi:hypothetical protein DSO57_1016414 [Entomophthora muscae]|uniref:Uncharacterized protein n=1 Tax=Entomophthora muscae TaxID=34485 RepID=A0ACC2TRU3_9FUNG|nr:hypothetical protein DSO57_1016414 [Entomophthora muscae]